MRIVQASLVVVSVTLLAQGASAAPDSAFQSEMFGHPITKSRRNACFIRRYDAAHLSTHPKQNVTKMTLLLTGRPGDEGAEADYHLGLRTGFRSSRAAFDTSGTCHTTTDPNGKVTVQCGVDCDGGAIDVKVEDKNVVMVGIPDGARIDNAKTGEPDSRKRFGADDKLFRLERTTLGECLPIAFDPDDKAALKRGE